MPIYEYICSKCNNYYEVLHSADHKESECPRCKGKLDRLFPRPNFKITRKNRLVYHPEMGDKAIID